MAGLDIVLASLHDAAGQPPDRLLARYLRAMRASAGQRRHPSRPTGSPGRAPRLRPRLGSLFRGRARNRHGRRGRRRARPPRPRRPSGAPGRRNRGDDGDRQRRPLRRAVRPPDADGRRYRAAAAGSRRGTCSTPAAWTRSARSSPTSGDAARPLRDLPPDASGRGVAAVVSSQRMSLDRIRPFRRGLAIATTTPGRRDRHRGARGPARPGRRQRAGRIRRRAGGAAAGPLRRHQGLHRRLQPDLRGRRAAAQDHRIGHAAGQEARPDAVGVQDARKRSCSSRTAGRCTPGSRPITGDRQRAPDRGRPGDAHPLPARPWTADARLHAVAARRRRGSPRRQRRAGAGAEDAACPIRSPDARRRSRDLGCAC